MAAADVRGLVKRYPSFELRDVTFSLEAGQITGFVGRNGAGKTTTIKAMLNMIRPNGGEVCFFGKPLAGNEAEIKKRVGYSTGTVSWYPRKKIRDIVSIIRRFYDTWDEAACRRYTEMFGLDMEKTPLELSEGMKVKLNLMLALSHRAEMLILDEPTSGLDPFSRSELLDVFTGLKAEGVAVFFSTHTISDLEKCADDIVYISRGRIVAALPKEDFMRTNAAPGESLEDALLRLEGGAIHA